LEITRIKRNSKRLDLSKNLTLPLDTVGKCLHGPLFSDFIRVGGAAKRMASSGLRIALHQRVISCIEKQNLEFMAGLPQVIKAF